MGFGKEFSRRVLVGGGRVVVADKNLEKGKETCLEFQEKFGTSSCIFQEVDVTKKEDWETAWKVAEEFFNNKIDVLVNNAGVSPKLGFEICMKINLDGVLLGCNMMADKLGKHNGGQGGLVVNTASMAGILYGMDKDGSSYQISKHGVVAATRTFGNRKIVRKTGIKHVALCPWFSPTSILDGSDKEQIAKKAPMGLVPVEKVGEAFQRMVKDQRSESLMLVMPDTPLVYYPDVSFALGIIVFLLSKMAHMFGVKTVSTKMLGLMLAVLVVLLFYILHLLLSLFGL